MDISQIINLVVQAVLTIVTTAVAVRLSLNKGKLGVTDELKARVMPKFKAYMKVVFSFLLFTAIIAYLYKDITSPGLPTRFDVFAIVLDVVAALIWFFVTLNQIDKLAEIRKQERPQDSQ